MLHIRLVVSMHLCFQFLHAVDSSSPYFRTVLAADVLEHAGEAVHKHGVQQHLHIHLRAVPHAAAAQPPWNLFYAWKDRLNSCPADSTSGQ